jgi:hypothetical protein
MKQPVDETLGPASVKGDTDPGETPRYTLSEAAAILRMPRSTLRAWMTGSGYSQPLIRRPRSSEGLLSFHNVVEAHIVRSISNERGFSVLSAMSCTRWGPSDPC